MRSSTSLLVVNFGTPQLVRNLLDSLRDHPDRVALQEVVIVDNGFPAHGDASTAVPASDYPVPVRFVRNEATSYASGVNAGIAACTGQIIAVANSDLLWMPDGSILPALQAMAHDPRIGVAGPQLLYPDGSWQRSHRSFPSFAQALRSLLLVEVLLGGLAVRRHRLGTGRTKPRRVDYVDGALMLIRRECLAAVGGFDERFPFYGEDADFCHRVARAGWVRVFVPQARVIHLRGASSTAVASVPYLEKLLAARTAFVERHRGRRRASWYTTLQLVAMWELALVYTLISGIVRTPAWHRRARLARAAARAAANLASGAATHPPTQP
jgi:GT2 family glycosyltransferase